MLKLLFSLIFHIVSTVNRQNYFDSFTGTAVRYSFGNSHTFPLNEKLRNSTKV